MHSMEQVGIYSPVTSGYAHNVNITTEGTGLSSGATQGYGILGYHNGTGAIDIDARGGSINTGGAYSYGIYGLHNGTGAVMIDTHDGHRITTIGPNGHGIVAYNYGTMQDTSRISIDVGGNVTTTGAGAQGVRVGVVNNDGAPERVAAIGADGYRQQTVTVNGSVMGNAAGVFLAGGGRVVIGPKGSIGAESGIAILATGDTPGADPMVDPAIKPKLRVDMNLGGRKVEQAIGDDWIINDGGETTIAVNGKVLHTGQGPSRTCSSVPDEPVWVRFAGGQGSYEADRSTTGATYNLERFETEGGLSAAFNDTTKGWVSVRHVWGAAGIGSPTGGGQIDVRGLGSSVGGAWQSPTGAYAKGCFSYMAYNVDFASHQRGLLKAGTNGRAYILDVEAGRRFALTGQVQLTPRVWVVGSRVTVDSFTDAVDARVSFADANRVIGGLGFVADTTGARGSSSCGARWTWSGCSAGRRPACRCRASG